eukprot:TRINITY_DN2578_c0_g1_i1.p1 TRINITY_DN2578_c0_g1~~TRINITY_DN2578_c0_g1_i1.p1  ORF type:complete len:124 (+),score=44.87 TRINITY_DN2578_c0_g1_i1:39-410(+)
MGRIKAHELRNKKKAELQGTLVDLKTELAQLRVAKVTGGAPAKLAKIKQIRKGIARVLTVMNQSQRQQLRTYFRGNQYKPIDLRAKKTRAIRRALTTEQTNAQTIRASKKAAHFPLRKYAVKA